MVKLTIDGKEIEVESGMTVIQACEEAGIEIPRFCYHEKLNIAGNCRMCLVEMEKSPKPIASCAMNVSEGMVIHTNTPTVQKAREGVMEFLLINHPLDCPICDQGGECDLQDQAMAYGRGKNRFHENKRSVKDKDMGPLIKTHMTRCIHCTRCIRFITEIAGVPELGATGRGENMEVGTYVEKAISSELSGNIIDLCPVGALTSKPYAFKARSWELRKIESIDVLDAVGSNIRIDYRGSEVMRILPRNNDNINEDWISDKARFSYDGLKYQRLDDPMIKENNKFKRVSWDIALEEIKKHFSLNKPSEIGVISGNMVDAESLFLIKKLCEDLNIENVDGTGGLKLDYKNRFSYLFNTEIKNLELADAVLLIGANPRYEASLVGARLRKAYRKNNTKFATIGNIDDQTYPVEYLGNTIDIIDEIIKGKNSFAEVLSKATNPVIIVGEEILKRPDSMAIQYKLQALCDKFNINRDNWLGYNVLLQGASRVAALDIGLTPKNSTAEDIIKMANDGSIKLLYLLGADEFDLSNIHPNTVVIYQGHHGDHGAHNADIILPGAAYTEKNGIYLNLEGRVQQTKLAVYPPKNAKQDWEIISDIIKVLGRTSSFDSLSELRKTLYQEHPHFLQIDHIMKADPQNLGVKDEILNDEINTICNNFYMTDPISRSSVTMANCAKLFKNNKSEDVA